GVHPLQGGFIRRKSRNQRRSGMPIESLLAFSLRRVREVFRTYVPTLRLFWKIDRMRRRIQRDPQRRAYTDLAIPPVDAVHDEHLELYEQTDAARQAAARAKARLALRPATATP